MRHGHQSRLAFGICNLKPRQSGLSGADQIARAANFQVSFGDFETVVGFAQGFQTSPPAFGQRGLNMSKQVEAAAPRPTRPRS